jgi:lysine 2,3-aminomutase
MSHTLQRPDALFSFLRTVLPDQVPEQRPLRGRVEYHGIRTAEDFIASVQAGLRKAPMAFRLSPHVLSIIDWQDPLNDPVRRQFIPLDSSINVNHPATSLDPLQETNSSPVSGLVHRYHNKALFLSS